MTAMEADAKAPPVNLWFAEARATLTLAWPMVLTNLAQTAMTATDVMLLGRLSPEALAAGTLGHNLYFLFTIFGMGLVIAASPMMARAIGSKYRVVRDVRRTVRQGLWVAILISIPMWIILWWTEDILLAMTDNAPLSAAANEYMRTLQWAMLPFFGYIVLRSFISALERPRWALVIAFCAVVFNGFAAWSLIFGHFGLPQLGLYGAGIATSLASLLMFVGMTIVVMLDRNFKRYRLFGNFWRADWPRMKTMLKLGLPIAGTLTFEVSIFNISAILMGRFDTATVAAHSIAISIASICFMVPMGLGQAATVRVGLAQGRRDIEGVARAGWTALTVSAFFMVFTALVMLLAPHLLIGAFLNANAPENQAVVVTATTFLVFAAIFQLADGVQAVTAGMLRGLHDTTLPMIYAAFGYWMVGLTLGFALAFYYDFGGAGIWIGLCVGLLVVSILLFFRWINLLKIMRLNPMQ